MSDLPTNDCAVPLVELLRSVPEDYRAIWEKEPYHHCSAPVGKYCHEAADRIEQLEAEVARLRSSVLACLGYWRDEMPDDAVAGFQQALQETADERN